MLAVRTPGAPQVARVSAAFGSAFPFEGQGRLLRSRSISGLFSRSLHSGLQPPCLRFAVAVTGHHARLGTRLLAKLCRGRHSRRLGYMRFQGATLTEPDVQISRFRFLAGELRSQRCNDGRSEVPVGGAALRDRYTDPMGIGSLAATATSARSSEPDRRTS